MVGSDYVNFQRTKFAETVGLLRFSVMPPQEMMASIILVNYNGWRDLERCLNSLENALPFDCEVIVVDNCSTDDSPCRIAQCFPFVRLVSSGVNLGFGAGNNLGAKLARGRVLVFLNPDTTVDFGWLQPLVHTLDADPSVGMVTSCVLLMNEPERINTCGNDMHISGLTLCRGMGKPRATEAQPTPVAAVSGAAFAIRRELFEEMGGFDETFFLYMEDTDLSLRIRLAGYRCVYVPDSIVYHDYALSFGPMKTYYQERNRYFMLLKNLRWPTLLVLLPVLLLAEAITWGYVFLHDRRYLRNKLFAYVWVLYWWQEIMKKRAQVQRQRRTRDRDLLRIASSRIDFGQADGSWVSRAAQLVFDPIFAVLRWSALALVWW